MKDTYFMRGFFVCLAIVIFTPLLSAQKGLAAKQKLQLKEVFPANAKVLAPGETCPEAIEITPGSHTVDEITTGNGAVIEDGVHAKWYSFTPATTGLATAVSCGITTVDTRVAILGGECDDLVLIGGNDDCDFANDNYASEFSWFAEAGVRYFVYWDDRWSGDGFDWELIVAPLPDLNVTFSVDMSEETVSPDGVNMVWAFADVESTDEVDVEAMADMDGDGVYTVTLPFTALDTIGYAFMNGALAVDNVEAVPDDCGLLNSFGFNIRPLAIVATEDVELSTVCFGSCEPCTILVEDCAEPFPFVEEDFETYAAGDLIANQSGDFDTWSGDPGGTEDAEVSDEQAFNGANALKISEENGDDLLLLLGDRVSGHYLLSWEMYVPDSSSAYYNFQKFETPNTEFGIQVEFFEDGSASLDAGGENVAEFDYPQGVWFTIIHVIDLNEDYLTLVVNNEIKYTGRASWTTFEQTGAAQLGAVDFFGNTDNLYYVDDIKYWQIPDADVGRYCYTAEEVELGTHSVPSVECFGAYYDRGFFSGGVVRGESGYWYKYVPETDGILSISSCDGPADTRGWILQGADCLGAPLDVWGVNDDQCLLDNGEDPYASYREALVTAGETYYILWDNIWDRTGFDWELALSTEAPVAGEFCQSAIEIEPGEHFVDEITGDAVVNRAFYAASSPATPYGQSIWYSFTPTTDGLATVSSCEGAASDTRVVIYTGECGGPLNSLEEIAFNDDAECGLNNLQSLVDSLELTAGTTYYIEWIDVWEDEPFAWELLFESSVPTAEVTFQVDMQLATVDPGGVFIAGSFSDFQNLPMDDGNGDGIFTTTLELAAETTYTYKFKNGPDGWETINTSIGDNCTTGDFADRFVEVGTDNETLDVVCFGYCVDCETVDVDEVMLSRGLEFFPNPATEQLQVRFDFGEVAPNLNLRLVNALGQVVAQHYLGDTMTDQLSLDVSKLPAGIYLLELASGKERVARTLVVE